MDRQVPNIRFEALQAICKAYKPTVPLLFLAALLGFVATSVARTAAPAASALAEAGKFVGSGAQEFGGNATGSAKCAALACCGAAVESVPPPGCQEAHFEGRHVAVRHTSAAASHSREMLRQLLSHLCASFHLFLA
jgi:hypothetical protein